MWKMEIWEADRPLASVNLFISVFQTSKVIEKERPTLVERGFFENPLHYTLLEVGISAPARIDIDRYVVRRRKYDHLLIIKHFLSSTMTCMSCLNVRKILSAWWCWVQRYQALTGIMVPVKTWYKGLLYCYYNSPLLGISDLCSYPNGFSGF